MKRYVYLILVCVGTLLLMTSFFYVVLSQDNFNIIFIKLQVNPSFIIGINENKNVVFYNALNDDANKYNLSMFQGKSLEEAVKFFIEKQGYASEGKDDINITVMTKNNSLEKELVSVIDRQIKLYDSNYKVISHEPTVDEMEKYSDEVIYNISSSISNANLKLIAESVYKIVDSHVKNRINLLNLNNLSDEEKRNMIKEAQKNDYFTSYNLGNLVMTEYGVVLLENSNYVVRFNFDDNYTYEIILNLEVENEKNELKKIVENYNFTYTINNGEGSISNLKRHFYSF